jgi:hypothetical protein
MSYECDPKQRRIACLLSIVSLLMLSGCGRTYETKEAEKQKVPDQFELATGTEIHVRPVTDLSPENMKAGSEFAGVVAEPLYYTRELIDPDGKTYHREALIAPEGAAVQGEIIMREPDSAKGAEDKTELGLKLTRVTLLGGMWFDIVTNPVYDFVPADGRSKHVLTAKKEDVVTFKLSQPADVSLVIDSQDKEGEQKQETAPAAEPTSKM